MIVYLGLGSNLGEREKNIRVAIECVRKIPKTKLLRVSTFYRTEPWGLKNQPDFINAAIKIYSALSPLELLHELQSVEQKLGRIRREKWGARTIDIDILLIERREIHSEELVVPHKYLFKRNFALIPLAEIFPRFKFEQCNEVINKIKGSPTDFNFKLIACVDKNFGIGLDGKLLFNISEDLKNFRQLTTNHAVIFGRQTLETLPKKKPLDRRRNIILSQKLKKVPGAEIVVSLEELFEKLRISEQNFVIGGAKVFEELIPYASEIFLTVVSKEVPADVFFPSVDEFLFSEKQNFGDYEFRRYTR